MFKILNGYFNIIFFTSAFRCLNIVLRIFTVLLSFEYISLQQHLPFYRLPLVLKVIVFIPPLLPPTKILFLLWRLGYFIDLCTLFYPILLHNNLCKKACCLSEYIPSRTHILRNVENLACAMCITHTSLCNNYILKDRHLLSVLLIGCYPHSLVS